MKSFDELGLNKRILQAIGEQGYEYPMPIQEAVIPVLLDKENDGGWQGDLVALAQTGTGKTAAYGLPIVQLTEGASLQPVSLILAPTRELCLQIADDLEGFSKYSNGVHILPVYGGTSIDAQIRALKRGINILVATPGRLIDLMKRGAADLSTVRNVVLDEADEMLTMGFQEDLNEILGGIPEEHRTLLFSATMSKEIENIARKYLKNSKEIQVGSRNEGAEHVNHIYYMVRAQDKYLALKRVVDYYPRIYGIVFCRTRMETQEIADKLIQDGYNADALHGELSQQQRDLTMQKFRKRRIQLLNGAIAALYYTRVIDGAVLVKDLRAHVAVIAQKLHIFLLQRRLHKLLCLSGFDGNAELGIHLARCHRRIGMRINTRGEAQKHLLTDALRRRDTLDGIKLLNVIGNEIPYPV